MFESVYRPAHTAATSLHERLDALHRDARREGRASAASLPSPEVIQRLIEAGFWASLRREEGRSPKISIAFLPPDDVPDPLRFDRRLLPTPRVLTRLFPAVERPGIHLGIWEEDEGLYLWGATRALPEYTLVLEVIEPGLVVAKYSRSAVFGKFGNLAMFKGDHVKVVDDSAARRPECPALLACLAGLDGLESPVNHPDVLVRLSISMRAHGHGGTLLLVPHGDEWKRSIVTPIQYRVMPPFDRLAAIVGQEPADWNTSWTEELRDAIDGLAGLTAVDGAAIMDFEYRLLAFGAKIERATNLATVREVVVIEPVVGHHPKTVDAASLGGMRHLSAAQFVHDQKDALALVASQDGRFTIFSWSHLEKRLHAHRIETLLF